MRGRWWQKRQKQQRAQQRRQQQGYYWQQQQMRQQQIQQQQMRQQQIQQQQMRQQQIQQQTSQSSLQPQRSPVHESPDWNYVGNWDDDGGVLGLFETVLKFLIVGIILFLVLRAIF